MFTWFMIKEDLMLLNKGSSAEGDKLITVNIQLNCWIGIFNQDLMSTCLLKFFMDNYEEIRVD